jgi:hypothetical protein
MRDSFAMLVPNSRLSRGSRGELLVKVEFALRVHYLDGDGHDGGYTVMSVFSCMFVL